MSPSEPRTNRARADDVRARLLDAILPEAAFDGWNAATLARAAETAGASAGEIDLYCPDGVLDLIEVWSRTADEEAAALIRNSDATRIRDRITQAVMIRLDALDGHEEAAERARARLLLPDAGTRGPQLFWATSDMIWRAIGDTSTDANFYSKRAILSGVYAATLSIRLSDHSDDKAKTRAFLDRRIENVMQFEKVKAQARKLSAGLPDLPGLAARLRYGFGRRV